MTARTEDFASPQVASFWRFIARSLTRLVATLDDLDETTLNWRPPAPQANSLYALTIHTFGIVSASATAAVTHSVHFANVVTRRS